MAINKTVNGRNDSHGALRNVINYVLQDYKIKDGLVCVSGPFDYDTIDRDKVYQSFIDEKKLWGKDSGRMYSHQIISFHRDEYITPEQALLFGKEFVDRWFPAHQALVAVHQDRDHVHIHIVINTVSLVDGKKLHNTKHDLQRMKDMTNDMCREHGFSVAQKGKHFDGTVFNEGEITAWTKDKYHLLLNDAKRSFVADCGLAVFEAIQNCCSRDNFISKMNEKGWKVHWEENRKHITFEDAAGNKVRDSNLSRTFTMDISKEALTHEFERQAGTRYGSGTHEGAERRLRKYYDEISEALTGRSYPATERNHSDSYRATEGSDSSDQGEGRDNRQSEAERYRQHGISQ